MSRGRGPAAAGVRSPVRRHSRGWLNAPMSISAEPVSDLLQVQHGVISLRQTRELGMSDKERRWRVESGRWERLAPSVYGIVDHRPSWRRALWVAHLWAGPESVVSHEPAGRLHRYAQVPAGLVALTVPRSSRHGPPGLRVHRTDDLARSEVVLIDGLPITSPARTVVDLAAVLGVARLRPLIEDQVVSKRLSLATIGAALDGVRRRGKPGVRRLSRVLDDLGPGDELPRSELERLLDRVIGLAGLPAPLHEHALPGRGAVVGFVDRCWPAAGLIVEGDGRRWHTRRQQTLLDATRTLEAQAVGFETSRLLWEHLAHDPHGTATLLRAVHDGRCELLGRSA